MIHSMGVTRFPQGVEVGDGTTASDFSVGGTAVNPISNSTAGGKIAVNGGTVITGAGTVVATGITTISTVVASLSGTVALAGTATGLPQTVQAGHNGGGSVVLKVYDATGAAATGGGTVSFVAYGA